MPMSKEIAAALVSLVIAVWSLLTAKKSRELALSAEESAKRGELVRIRALEATDSLLCAVADLVSIVGGIGFLVNFAGGISMENESIRNSFKEFGEKRAYIMKLRIQYAPYLTEDLIKHMDLLFESTERLSIDQNYLKNIEGKLRLIGNQVADNARQRFLEKI